MTTRRFYIQVAAIFLLFAHPVIAQEKMEVAPNEAVIKVSGAVCSFCTLGIQKKLEKLSFIETSKYNKGSLMDIEKQRLTIAIKPDQTLDLEQVYDTILNGGYEPHGAAVGMLDGDIVHYDAKGRQCDISTSSC